MRNERLYRTEAIVVRRRNQGEADRVLTVCTPLGKLELLAKGVRKTRSRKSGHLELFAHARILVARSRSSWDLITQAETAAPHVELRGDLVRGTYAHYVVELYDRFVSGGEGGMALFELLRRTMGYLSREERLDLLVRAYEQRLLSLAGFRPEWDRCVGERGGELCERSLHIEGNQPFGLDPDRGGGLCPDCFRAHREELGVIPLSPPAIETLRVCQRESLAQLRRRSLPPGVLKEIERAARHYITYHLEHDLRSGAFLRRLRREGIQSPKKEET